MSSDLIEVSLASQRVVSGNVFPLVLSPKSSSIHLPTWLASNQPHLDDLLRQHRGILFRGFSRVSDFNDFHEAVEATGYLGMDYIGGAAVRSQLTSRIFTANESPSSERIPFHHEMAQTPHPPSHIFFFCEVPPSEGGETPLLVSNEIYERARALHPDVMEDIERVGVKYIRVMPKEDDPSSAIGRGWKSTFLCETKEEAEEALRKLGSTWEWCANDDLRTISATLPAIRLDTGIGRSEQKTFFNSIIAAYTGWNDSRNVGREAVVLADGRALDERFMTDVVDLMEQCAVAIPWEQGDLLLLDNRTAMHSRRPFTGPRRILASLVRDQSR